jgi:hypothetical protein
LRHGRVPSGVSYPDYAPTQERMQHNVSIHLHLHTAYAIMGSMERKAQQQTLSIRISDALREYLERAKNVMSSSRGDGVSTSDVAKMLLESAKDDRLDHRLEVADLQHSSAESLWNIRRKWEQAQGLSHAEWLFVAQYVQVGCEELAEDPEHPLPESFAQVLEAFLAVRALRMDRGVELDRYYLGNLGLTDGATLNQRQLDPEVVPKVTGSLIHELRQSQHTPKPVFCARNFYVALRDETLPGVAAIDAALSPYLPRLFRLGARGHWLRERKPVRPPRIAHDFVSPTFPSVASGDYRLSILVASDGEIEMLLDMNRKDVAYPLTRYPRVREFATMVARLEPGRYWKGREFFGYTNDPVAERASRFYFRHRRNGIAISFTCEEWQSLKELFEKAFAMPELQPILEELSLVYGEI